MTADRLLDGIRCAFVDSATELLAAVHRLQYDSMPGDCRLIVIDSLGAVFRQRRAAEPVAVGRLAELMGALESLADARGCAVVLTNELTTRLAAVAGDASEEANRGGGASADWAASSTLAPALGDTLVHRIAQVVLLDGGDCGGGDESSRSFTALVTKSLCGGSRRSAEFQVSVLGILNCKGIEEFNWIRLNSQITGEGIRDL